MKWQDVSSSDKKKCFVHIVCDRKNSFIWQKIRKCLKVKFAPKQRELLQKFHESLKFKLLIDNLIENRPKGVPKRIIYLILAISFSKLYTWGSEHKYRHMRLKRVRAFLSWVRAFYRACAHFIASVHVCNNCACNCAWIFMKMFFVVNYYLMS